MCNKSVESQVEELPGKTVSNNGFGVVKSCVVKGKESREEYYKENWCNKYPKTSDKLVTHLV